MCLSPVTRGRRQWVFTILIGWPSTAGGFQNRFAYVGHVDRMLRLFNRVLYDDNIKRVNGFKTATSLVTLKR